MNTHPNLARLAERDPNTLTARELQVLLIARDAANTTGTAIDQAKQTIRLGRDVPALLAHIDELHGEITSLRTTQEKATAAELRRIAAIAHETAQDFDTANLAVRKDDYLTFARTLKNRASELDGD